MTQTRLRVSVNERTYQLVCDEGQEDALRRFAARLDSVARPLAAAAAAAGAGEAQVLVMAGVMLADAESSAKEELKSLRARVGALEKEVDAAQDRAGRATDTAGRSLQAMASRVDRLAGRIALAGRDAQ